MQSAKQICDWRFVDAQGGGGGGICDNNFGMSDLGGGRNRVSAVRGRIGHGGNFVFFLVLRFFSG
jgi:hypothetical protein